MAALPLLSDTTLDVVCRALADAATHKELTLLFSQCSIEQRGGNPKWERMLLALVDRQKQDRCGNNAIRFFTAVLHPSRFGGRLEAFETFRTDVNYQLA